MDFLTGQIICVDKPLRWTSFDVVKRLRAILIKRYGMKKFKVGHAGTLDPLATGVMIVCTGRLTKEIENLQAGVKEYIATLQLGATTPSFDLESQIDATYPTDHIDRDLIDSALGRFKGVIHQVPPAFSACKVDGKRAYRMARRGEEVELKPKVLEIKEIETVDFDPEKMSLTIRVVCGKGTYIRALARDIGQALGSGAHLTALRRTRVGEVGIERCLTIDEAADWLSRVELEYPADYPPELRKRPLANADAT